jgi:hypothetical protein
LVSVVIRIPAGGATGLAGTSNGFYYRNPGDVRNFVGGGIDLRGHRGVRDRRWLDSRYRACIRGRLAWRHDDPDVAGSACPGYGVCGSRFAATAVQAIRSPLAEFQRASTPHSTGSQLMARRCRSASATTIGAGASVAQVKRLLDQFNGSLDHPLDDDEINTTVASIAQTHLRNHPGAAIRIAPSLPPSGPPPGNYPFPDDLLSPPGLLGEVTRYIVASALKPQPILALGAAITALGTVMGRKVRTTTDLRTNIYAVSVADSGAGKEHTRKAIKMLLHAAHAEQRGIDDFG